MKMNKTVFLGLLFIANFTFGQSKMETVNVKVSIYCDHCKRCESCGKRLEDAVYSLKGIKRVDLDEKSKTLKIIYNPSKTSPDKIRQVIANVGFDADDVKANPEAYSQLDNCCKKE